MLLSSSMSEYFHVLWLKQNSSWRVAFVFGLCFDCLLSFPCSLSSLPNRLPEYFCLHLYYYYFPFRQELACFFPVSFSLSVCLSLWFWLEFLRLSRRLASCGEDSALTIVTTQSCLNTEPAFHASHNSPCSISGLRPCHFYRECTEKRSLIWPHKFSASLLPQVKFCEANNMSKHAGLIPIIWKSPPSPHHFDP